MKRSPIAAIATAVAIFSAACLGLLALTVLGEYRDRLGTEIGRAIGSAVASVLIFAITANFWPAYQFGGLVGRTIAPPTPSPAETVVLSLPTSLPSTSTPASTPTSPATATSTSPPPTPSQLYITCNDGTEVIGTTIDGACRDRGGVRAASTQAPASLTSTPSAPSQPPPQFAPPLVPSPSATTAVRLTSTSTATPVRTATPTMSPAAPPTITRTTSPPSGGQPIPTAEERGEFPCAVGQIKGNRNSMIYHRPGQRDYGRTYQNVQCFATEAEAQAAGYRAAER